VGESSAGRPPFGTAPVDRGPTTLKEDDFNTSQVETFSDTTHSCLNPKPVTTIVGVFVQCFSLLVKQRNIDVLYEFISMIESWRGLRWLLLSFVRQWFAVSLFSSPLNHTQSFFALKSLLRTNRDGATELQSGQYLEREWLSLAMPSQRDFRSEHWRRLWGSLSLALDSEKYTGLNKKVL